MIDTEPAMLVAREGRVPRVRLNRPGKRNALRITDCAQIVAILNEAELDDAVASTISRFSPEAIRRGLDYVRRSRGASPREAADLADVMRRLSYRSAGFAEGVSAFFGKRQPRWPSLEKA